MKAITAAVDAALKSKSLRVGILAEITLPDARVARFWSGLGTLVFNGNSWSGLGKLGRITWSGETAELRTTETSYEISGVLDALAVSEFIQTPVRNGLANAWLCVFDEAGQVVPDPVLIDKTILDVASLHYGQDGQATLALRGTSAIFDFRKPRGRYLTNEQLQADYPGDTGFDRIPALANRIVSWTKA